MNVMATQIAKHIFNVPRGVCRISLIIGKDKDPQIPSPDTILEEGDQIVSLTDRGARTLFGSC